MASTSGPYPDSFRLQQAPAGSPTYSRDLVRPSRLQSIASDYVRYTTTLQMPSVRDSAMDHEIKNVWLVGMQLECRIVVLVRKYHQKRLESPTWPDPTVNTKITWRIFARVTGPLAGYAS